MASSPPCTNQCNLLLQIFSTITGTISAEVLNVLSRGKLERIISASGTHVKLVGETLESSSWSDMQKIYGLLVAEVSSSYFFFSDIFFMVFLLFVNICQHFVVF